MKNKKIFYSLVFIFFVIILFLSPICGDDWSNYIVSKTGFYHAIGNAIGMYFDWEGRFVSRILINLLTGNKIIWNIVNSLMIIGIIYFIIKLVNPKKKKLINGLSLLVILCMNMYTFSQVVVWIAGNITYLFIITLLLGYFYYIINYRNNKKYIVILFSFLNLIMTMFVEHMAVILIIANIMILISTYIKTKKIDKEILIYLICSVVGTSLMLLSPGSLNRSTMENVSFSKLSLINKILYNIPNFIYYTFIVNSFLLILMSISNYYLIKDKIKNKVLKNISYIYMLIIPILTCMFYNLNSFFNTGINLFTDSNSVFLTIYYISYILITLIFIYLSTKSNKCKKVLFFFIIGISSNVIMMVSPTWGYRTSFSTYIFLSISMLIIIDKYIRDSKIKDIIIYIVIILVSSFYLILYTSVYMQYKCNLRLIEKGIKNKSKVIEIYKYPYFSNCNINPENEFHMSRFKKYYKIGKDVEVKLIDNNWKYIIIYHK